MDTTSLWHAQDDEEIEVGSLPVEEDYYDVDWGQFVIATRDTTAFVGGHSDEIYGFWVVEAVDKLEDAAIFRHPDSAKAFIRDNADELKWEGLDPSTLEIYRIPLAYFSLIYARKNSWSEEDIKSALESPYSPWFKDDRDSSNVD